MTLQRQRVPDQSVRLVGSTLKLWSEAGLAARQPLLVVRDVVHHCHLERGRLLLWRIKVGAAGVAEGRAARWACTSRRAALVGAPCTTVCTSRRALYYSMH
jgi:hypothetical protein